MITKTTTRQSLEAETQQILDRTCDYCQGKGYTETGGMAMEDDLVEKIPCDEPIHDPSNTHALLKTVDRYVEERELLARIDERILVDFEVEREAEATAKAQAFTTPEGLDGYKCAVRDVHLDNGDRRKLLESQSEALRQQVKGGES